MEQENKCVFVAPTNATQDNAVKRFVAGPAWDAALNGQKLLLHGTESKNILRLESTARHSKVFDAFLRYSTTLNPEFIHIAPVIGDLEKEKIIGFRNISETEKESSFYADWNTFLKEETDLKTLKNSLAIRTTSKTDMQKPGAGIQVARSETVGSTR
ncbi:MAG: hypothetical protein Q9169_005104 [Polycauliona sp. 2 TL-2023]